MVLREESRFPEPGRLLRAAGDVFEGEARFRTYEGPHGVQFLVGGIGRFWVEPNGASIAYELEPGCPYEDARHVLTGPVIGMAMQLAGYVLLHASGLVADGRAVAMSAPSGLGKSTLCATFGRAGYPLIADDMLVLDPANGLAARAYLPQIKLWDDSVAAFGEVPEGFDPVLSWVEKRRVTVAGSWGTAAEGAFPLGAVYLLAPSPDETTELAITPIPIRDAALALMTAMYMPETLTGSRARNAFEAATELTNGVPVRRIAYYRSYENLAVVRDAILRDAAAVRHG